MSFKPVSLTGFIRWPRSHRPVSLHHDRVALPPDLHLDRFVFVRHFMDAKFSCIHQFLQLRHVRTVHPPEIVIDKNNARHDPHSRFFTFYPLFIHKDVSILRDAVFSRPMQSGYRFCRVSVDFLGKDFISFPCIKLYEEL